MLQLRRTTEPTPRGPLKMLAPLRYLAAVAALLVFSAAPVAAQDDRVLVPGDPPLTRQMVLDFIDAVEWHRDVELTPAERQAVANGVVRAWQTKDRRQMNTVIRAIEWLEAEQAAEEAEINDLRHQTQMCIIQNIAGRNGGPDFCRP